MARYDRTNELGTGYAIFRDGVPFQVAYRPAGVLPSHGSDTLRSWKAGLGEYMPGDIAMFLNSTFVDAINFEAYRRMGI